MRGRMAGTCSGENWHGKLAECESSCVHSSLLRLAPYYALWYPGPLAKDFRAKEMLPRYKHDATKLSLRTRGIDLSLSDVMMSDICKSADLHFVGISLYSPRYKAKVRAAAIDSAPAARTPRKRTLAPSPEP